MFACSLSLSHSGIRGVMVQFGPPTATANGAATCETVDV